MWPHLNDLIFPTFLFVVPLPCNNESNSAGYRITMTGDWSSMNYVLSHLDSSIRQSLSLIHIVPTTTYTFSFSTTYSIAKSLLTYLTSFVSLCSLPKLLSNLVLHISKYCFTRASYLNCNVEAPAAVLVTVIELYSMETSLHPAVMLIYTNLICTCTSIHSYPSTCPNTV